MNPSRDKKIRQAPQKEGVEIPCDPDWCVHKSDAQNVWDDNPQTHTDTQTDLRLLASSYIPGICFQ